MKMIDGFSLYQQQMSNKTTAGRKGMGPAGAHRGANAVGAPNNDGRFGMEPVDTFERSSGIGQVNNVENKIELSETAQAFLDELRQTYSNMDFMVADFSTEEEAQQYMSRGTKEYSVLIDPETLEKMAADTEERQKFLDVLDNVGTKFDEIKEQLGDDAQSIDRLTLSVDGEGNIKYFAHLTKMSEKQRENIEASREARQKKEEEEAAAAQKKLEAEERMSSGIRGHRPEVKMTQVSSDTIEGLVEQIKNIDWDSIETIKPVGGKFDFFA